MAAGRTGRLLCSEVRAGVAVERGTPQALLWAFIQGAMGGPQRAYGKEMGGSLSHVRTLRRGRRAPRGQDAIAKAAVGRQPALRNCMSLIADLVNENVIVSHFRVLNDSCDWTSHQVFGGRLRLLFVGCLY